MVDYYEELNLNRSDSLDAINKALSQLESTWKRREINSPEKATRILAVILEARSAFKSQDARIKYDRELAASKMAPSPINLEAEREKEFLRWKKEANTYFDSEQLDLAEEAVNRALQFSNPNKPDASLPFLRSMLAYKRGNIQSALSFVNDAILANPNKAYFYAWKADILGDFFNATIENPDSLSKALDFLNQNRSCAEKALQLYRAEGDIEGQIDSLKQLAESYALIYNSDFELAEKYAHEAIALGGKNPELQNLLESIAENREAFQPYQGASHPSTSSGGGCYIATAVYGSYDCPEVWTLRRFRDTKLAKTVVGKLFIMIYYRTSPFLVSKFGNREKVRQLCKVLLDKLVARLNMSGISSEPYVD